MTIAFGILASDGVVIAADREEGDGYLKNDRGKIRQTFRGRQPIGSIAITGAGEGPPLDEISRLMSDAFCAEREDISSDAVAELLIDTHRNYYREVILPFALQPIMERPDYSLIVGCFGGGIGQKLFSTSKLGFNPTSDYEAVGVGSSVANNWLSRLYDYVPLQFAIKVAAYVLYQVKATVGGCGLGSDIAILKQNGILEGVPPATIRKWEEVFRYYPTLERNVFHYCIGLNDPGLLQRTKVGKQPIDSDLEEIRKELMPSAAQKSAGQQ